MMSYIIILLLVIIIILFVIVNKKSKKIIERFNESQRAGKIGSWEFNAETEEVWWSDTIYDIFEVDKNNYKPSVLKNAEFVHPEDTKAYHVAFNETIKTGSLLDYDARIVVPSGKIKTCKSIAVAHYDENKKVTHVFGSVIDITDMAQIKNELMEAKEKAEKSTRLKSEFLANISHELRTPLNGIIGFSEYLADIENDDKKREILKMVEISGQNLLQLINDILDLSKIEAGKMTINNEEFSMTKFVNEVGDEYTKLCAQKGNKFCSNINIKSDKVMGDRLRINQILVNLLGNSNKFTNNGEITLGVTEKKNDEEKSQYEFVIKDTGIGISKEKLANLFEAFDQGNNLITKQYGGTGLGLSIVKKLVDIMNGRIYVESEEGAGTTFTITITMETLD